jgi:hypothetical protein
VCSSDLFLRRNVNRKELRALVGLPGYDADAIREVLRSSPTRVRVAEGRVLRDVVRDDTYEMWTYHGEIEPDEMELLSTRTQSDMSGEVTLDVTLRDGDEQIATTGVGNGPVSAFLEVVRAQGFDITLYDYVEHTLSAGGDAQAASYVELQVDGERLWGVGIDGDISTASLKAIVSGVNRAIRTRERSGALAGVSA